MANGQWQVYIHRHGLSWNAHICTRSLVQVIHESCSLGPCTWAWSRRICRSVNQIYRAIGTQARSTLRCLPSLIAHRSSLTHSTHIPGAAFADGFNAETLVILTTVEAGAGHVTVLHGYRCQLSNGCSRIRWIMDISFLLFHFHLAHHHICELVVISTGTSIDARLWTILSVVS